ncbi:hypothetical protein [Nocardioides limicola]|uniref:hypothetical protein n=1 Tax=Nocardioides limicola TaxID=2803368 RepID=UPI00193BFEAC|nr:hypothetical protein [Nocardioides sp. DJM-14]
MTYTEIHGGTASGSYFFVPHSAAPALPDPAAMAEEAFSAMRLTTPTVRLAPAPPLMTYVGLETWLWIDPSEWEPLTRSVTAGDTTVTVTAQPVRTTWQLGDGNAVACGSAGRAWVIGMTSHEQTECQHVYTRVSRFEPDGTFAISAVIEFRVDWVCTGACLTPDGNLGEVPGPAGESAIRVGERQTVVIMGDN